MIILLFSLQSCSINDPKYIHFGTKESPDFYINEINSRILNSEDYSLEIFNTNLYKKIKIDDTEKVVIENFINSLANANYIDNEKPSTQEVYQMRITFNDEKYIINIYNESMVTVFPWDGIYDEDIINMVNVPERYNLLDFCENIEKRINLNQ